MDRSTEPPRNGTVTEATDPEPAWWPNLRVPYPHFQRWARAAILPLVLMPFFLEFLFGALAGDLYTLEFVAADLPVSDTELIVNHGRFVNLTATIAVLGTGALALGLVWLYQVYVKLRAVGVEGLRFSPATAMAAWLVPGLNLILSVLVMREVWKASDPYARGTAWRRNWTNPLIVLWWVGTVAALVFVAIALSHVTGTPTATDLIARDHAYRLATLIAIPVPASAAILIAMVDRRVLLAEDRAAHPDWRAWTKGVRRR